MIDDTIAKFEEATEVSRELDAAFAQVIGAPFGPSEGVDLERRAIYQIPEIAVHYTTNLQHAVDAVPEGWRWLAHDGDGCETRGFASLHPVGRSGEDDFLYGIGNSPALALCLAILRAHKAMGETG